MSNVVGTALIRVIPDTSGFSAQLSAQLQGATTAGASGANRLSSAFAAFGAQLDTVALKAKTLGATMTSAFTIPLGILSGAGIKTALDFENAMLQVKAVLAATGDLSENEIAGQMEFLTQKAREFGREGQFSAVQVAEGFNYIARAGLSANEVTAAMSAILNVATAEQIDLAEATDIVLGTLKGYRLEVSEVNRVTDVLAFTAGKTLSSIESLGIGFSYAGPFAAAAGLSFQETAAALGLLENAGIKAERAGTSLRGIIARLAAPSKEARNALRELGIEVEAELAAEMAEGGVAIEETHRRLQQLGITVFDSSGKMRPLADILQQLQDRGMTAGQAFEIFGQRAGPAAQALIGMQFEGEKGADALRKLTAEIEGAGGAAQRMADAQMEGLRGSLLRAKNSFVDLSIAIAKSGVFKTLADVLGGVTAAVQKLGSIAPWMLAFASYVTLSAVAAGPLLKVVGFLADGLSLVAKGIALVLTPAGAFVAAVGTIAVVLRAAYDNSQSLRDQLAQLGRFIDAAVSPAFEFFGGLLDGVGEGFARLTGTLGDFIAIGIGELNQAIENLILGWKSAFDDTIPDTGSTLQDFMAVIGNIVQRFGWLRDILTGVETPFASVDELVENTSSHFGVLGEAAAAVIDWLDRANSALLLLRDSFFDGKSGLDSFTARIDNVVRQLAVLNDQALPDFVGELADVAYEVGQVVGLVQAWARALQDAGPHTLETAEATDALQGKLGNFGGVVADVLGKIEDFQVALQVAGDVFTLAFGGKLGQARLFVDILQNGLPGIGGGADELTGKLAALGGELGGIFGGIRNFVDAWRDAGPGSAEVNEVLEDMRGNLGGVGDAVAGLLDSIASFATDIGPVAQQVGDFFVLLLRGGAGSDEAQSRIDRVRDSFGWLGDAAAIAMTALDRFVSFMRDTVIPVAIEVASAVKDFLGTGFQTLTSFIQTTLIPAAQDIGPQVWDKIKEGAAALQDGLSSFISWAQTTLVPFLQEYGPRAVEAFRDIFVGAWELIDATVVPIVRGLLPHLDDLAAILAGALFVAIDNLGPVLSTLADLLRPVGEFIGNNLLPILAVLAGAFVAIQVAPFIASLIGAAGAIGGLIGAIGGVISSLGVLGGLGAVLSAIVSPAVAVGGAIAAVIALFVILWQRSEAFRESIMQALSGIGSVASGIWATLQNIWDVISGIFQGDWGKVLDGMRGLWDALKDQVLTGILELSGGIVGAIKAGLDELLGALSNIPIIGPIFDGMKESLDGVLTVVQGLLEFLAGIFTLDWGRAGEGLKTAFGGIADWLYEQFVALPQRIAGIAGEIGGLILDALGSLASRIPGALATLGSAIWGWVSTELPRLLVEGFTLAIEGLSSLASLLGDAGKSIIRFLVDGAKSVITGIGDLVKDIPEIIVGVFTGDDKAESGIGKWLTDTLQGAWNWVKDNIPSILANAGKVIVEAILGGLKLAFWDIPKWMVTEGIPLLWDLIVEFGPRVLAAIGNILSQLPSFLWEALKGIGEVVWTILTTIPGIFVDLLGDLGELLVGLLTGAWQWVVDNGPTILANLGTWLAELPGKILGWLGSLGEKIGEWFSAAWQWLVDNGPALLEAFVGFWQGLPGTILGWMGSFGEKIGEWVSAAFQWLIDNGPLVITKLWEFFSGLPGKIGEAIGNLGDWLFNNVFLPATQWLADNWPIAKEKILGFFRELPGNIGSAIGNLGDWLYNNILLPAAQWLADHWPGAREKILGFFRDLPGNIGSAIGNLGSWLWDNVFAPARDWLSQHIPGMIDTLVNFFRGIPQRIVDAIAGIGGMASDFGKTIVNAIIDFVNTRIIDFINRVELNTPLGTIGLPDIGYIQHIAHEGGIIGRDRMRKFTGKMKPDEVPIIAQVGEGVLPRSVMSKLGESGFDAIMAGEGVGAVAATLAPPTPSLAGLAAVTAGTPAVAPRATVVGAPQPGTVDQSETWNVNIVGISFDQALAELRARQQAALRSRRRG
jgi:TP901 family phage tail tape measure protein